MQLAISTSAFLGVWPLNCAPRLNCEGELWGAICAGRVEVSIFVLYVRCNMAFAKYIYHNTIQYYLACLYCLDYTFGISIYSRNYVWTYYIYVLLDTYYHIIILCMVITMINFHKSETFWSFELKKNPCTQAGEHFNPCATLSRPRRVHRFFLLILNKKYVYLVHCSLVCPLKYRLYIPYNAS